MDVKNFSAAELSLRLLFVDSSLGQFAISDAAQIGAGADWQTVSFGVSVADLSPLGSSSVATTMSDVLVLRLLHAPTAGFPNAQPNIAAQIGVDNVAVVPLPAAALLFAPALAGLLLRQRRCQGA